MSTRYDREPLEWALKKTGLSRAELLKTALDLYIAGLLRDAA